MKSKLYLIVIFLMGLSTILQAQDIDVNQVDLQALEVKYDKLVKEADSPEKEQFVEYLKQIKAPLLQQSDSLKRLAKLHQGLTEEEKAMDYKIADQLGKLARWLAYLQKDKIRRHPDFQRVWSEIKDVCLTNPGDPRIRQAIDAYAIAAILEADSLPEKQRLDRMDEIWAITTLLSVWPTDEAPTTKTPN